jgi:hypothetical protein
MAVFKGAGCKFNTFTQRGALNTTCVLRLRFVTAAAGVAGDGPQAVAKAEAWTAVERSLAARCHEAEAKAAGAAQRERAAAAAAAESAARCAALEAEVADAAAAKEAAARALEREREFLERRAAEATKEKESACR